MARSSTPPAIPERPGTGRRSYLERRLLVTLRGGTFPPITSGFGAGVVKMMAGGEGRGFLVIHHQDVRL